jgi:hypothetical protein
MNPLINKCNNLLRGNGFEYVLLYKSTDLTREENRQDFDLIHPHLSSESKQWLRNSLIAAVTDGHEWIEQLEAQ